jgi:hypothetical protein
VILATVGIAFTGIAVVLPVDKVLTQPAGLVIEVIVTVVEPALASTGVLNVPLVAPIVNVAVLPVATLAPVRLYVAVKVPTPSDVEFAVIIEAFPIHTVVAVGDVKLVTFGFALTANDAVLVLDKALLQPSAASDVIVIVVDPVAASKLLGMLNVPLEAPMVSVAVFPEEVFAPVRLYVAVNVPAPKLVEFTVTVEAEPEQAFVADGAVKLVTLGNGFTTTAVVAGDGHEFTPFTLIVTL